MTSRSSGIQPLTRRRFLVSVGASVAGVLTTACSDSVEAPSAKNNPPVPDSQAVPLSELFDPLQPPTQFQLRPSSGGSVRTSWIGGSVRSGEPSYRLFVDGAPARDADGLAATITDLPPGPHAIAVATVDADGSVSRLTPESVVVIDAGSSAATSSAFVLEAVPAASSIQFRWALDDGYGGPEPDGYQLVRQGLRRPVAITTRDGDSAPDTWFRLGPVAPNMVAEYFVEAVDSSGRVITRSTNSVRVAPYYRAWPRSYPSPSAPRDVRVSRGTAEIALAWTASTDSDTNVFADGAFVTQVRAGESTVRLPSGESKTVTLQSVSQWGVTASSASVSSGASTPRRVLFTTRDGKILDPDGRPFIPVGTNLSGPDFFWNEAVLETADDARDNWRMTAVRLDCGMRDWGAVSGAQGYLYFTNNDLDRIIAEYTGAGLVVILAQFNKGLEPAAGETGGGLLSTRSGSAPDGTDRSVEDATTDWCIEVARRYRDNPRVWINPINEPRNDIDGLAAQYGRMVTRIRAVAPLTPLVLDAANFANDIPLDADIGDGPIREGDSFVMRHGQSLVDQFGEPRGYGPIIFSIHVYSRWPRNYEANTIVSDEKLAARMRQYVRDVRSRGLAILVGETGVEDFAFQFDSASVRVGLYEQGRVNGASTGVWPEQEVGVIAWHASPVSGMPISRGRSWSAVTDISEAAPPPDAGAGIWAYGQVIRR